MHPAYGLPIARTSSVNLDVRVPHTVASAYGLIAEFRIVK